VPEPLAALERYTYAALMTGHVDLPGRPVQAAVWFRLLRSLLHEVSLAISTRRASSQVALKKIWTITGLPPRAGLNVWTPYEQMPLLQQHDLMTAAAAALQLAADGVITARGRLATAIQPPPDAGQHRLVCPTCGDAPGACRHDPAQMLSLSATFCN
jgi:hypothetical protein